jgi:uncharacterized membrane protein
LLIESRISTKASTECSKIESEKEVLSLYDDLKSLILADHLFAVIIIGLACVAVIVALIYIVTRNIRNKKLSRRDLTILLYFIAGIALLIIIIMLLRFWYVSTGQNGLASRKNAFENLITNQCFEDT